jgi:hypothetical protein
MYFPVSQLFTYRFSSPGRLLRAARVALALTLVFYAVTPSARALSPPPPDGGYPNANTAEAEDALFNLTTGSDNTVINSQALWGSTITAQISTDDYRSENRLEFEFAQGCDVSAL